MLSRPMLSRRDFIRRANGVALMVPFFGLIASDETHAGELQSYGGKTMGTTWNVKLASVPGTLDGAALESRIQASLQEVDDLMTTYRATSELSQVNAGTRQKVSPMTAEVIKTALDVAGMTSGAFDPTVGPLVDLWGFGPNGTRNDLPSAAEIEQAAAQVGHDRVGLDDTRITSGGTKLDLSGVAKGFGVDRVADLLKREGIDNFLVEVGGEVRTSGQSPEDRPWRLGIEKPDPASRDIHRVLDLSGQALASSGNYRIFFENDGQRYAHIIDPRTGRPVDHDLASVTVLAPTTIEADALSTAMLVLGADDALAFARQHDIAAYMIAGRAGEFRDASSPAFERLFSA